MSRVKTLGLLYFRRLAFFVLSSKIMPQLKPYSLLANKLNILLFLTSAQLCSIIYLVQGKFVHKPSWYNLRTEVKKHDGRRLQATG